MLLVATACSGGDGGDDDDETVRQPPAPAASATVSQQPSPPPQSNGAGSADRSETCAEVVAGINAFNAGDYRETVDHFVAAVPLAEAADDGSAAAGDLLEAVRYYAALDPEDYPEASASSPEFERWKVVTLGQCVGGADTEDPGTDGPGVQA